MPDDKPAISSRDAMSRALGAAFLSHQVEQLEKTVSAAPTINRKDRRPTPAMDVPTRGRGGLKRGGAVALSRGQGGKLIAKAGDGGINRNYKDETRGREGSRGSDEEARESERGGKDADIVVVDASVLVHAIGQLKKWCSNGREEVVIVPLEALNTLDLLKKGTTPLAQRARGASRILEQQVGANPRIRVQRDNAFVLWDSIPFQSQTAGTEQLSTSPEDTKGKLDGEAKVTPEWLRRTICCARYELEHAVTSAADNADKESSGDKVAADPAKPQPRAILAVCTPPFPDTPTAVESAPVPLPLANKHEQRAAGVLVTHWASLSGVPVLPVAPTQHPAPPGPGAPANGGGRPRSQARHGRGSSDEDWRATGFAGTGARPRLGSVGRKPAKPAGSERLVERPPATVAMNASSLMQPARVVRVLARGEKLEP